MQNFAAVVQENEKLKEENALLQNIVKRLVLDCSRAMGSQIPRMILWPSGLREVAPLILRVAPGKVDLLPAERFQHAQRPIEDVDNAVVVALLQKKPKTIDAPVRQEHSPLCAKQTLPVSECPLCGQG